MLTSITFVRHVFIFLAATTAILSTNGRAIGSPAPPRFELLHLWATPEEAYALEAFVAPAKKVGVFWSEHAVNTNFIGVRRAYAERLALYAAPTGVFWIGGNDAVSGLIEKGTFRDIPFISGDLRFNQILRKEVLEVVQYNETSLSLLPLGIHLQNHIVYNDRLLKQFSAKQPTNWSEFLEVAEQAYNKGYYGISVSDQRWQVRFLIGSILVEYFPPDEFEELIAFKKAKEGQRDKLQKAYTVFKKLRKYANPDLANLAWDKTVDHVVNGKALANVLGDFSSPLLPETGDFKCALPPGNKYVLWSLDTIAFSKTDDPTEIEGQDIFQNIVGTAEYNQNYIVRKGGIPAYQNADPSLLHSCSQSSINSWDKAERKFLLSSREWTQSLDAIATISATLWQKPEFTVEMAVEETLHSLRALSMARESNGIQ